MFLQTEENLQICRTVKTHSHTHINSHTYIHTYTTHTHSSWVNLSKIACADAEKKYKLTMVIDQRERGESMQSQEAMAYS